MKNLTHALKTSYNSYKALGLTHNSGLSQLLYKLHVYKMYITANSQKIPFIITTIINSTLGSPPL